VGLLEQAQQSGRSLSGGQQQRLALARAWVSQPQLWLLDEPTASLDSSSKREVEQLIRDFSIQEGNSLVWVSHQLMQVKKLATRVVFLDKGKIILDLPHADFFNVQFWPSFPLPVQDLLNEEFIT
jgi:tungstate transport system ATP-binding protein